MLVSTTNQAQALEGTRPINSNFYCSVSGDYEASFGHDPGLSKFLQLLLRHLPANASVIDMGCGTGRPVSSTLAAAGHCVSGLDISPEMVRLCREAVPQASFMVGDMATYKPPTGTTFDAVLFVLSLFEYGREDMEALFARASTWVVEGGIIGIVSFPAEDLNLKDNPGMFDDDGKCLRDWQKQFMGRVELQTHFTRSGWKNLLGTNGFEIVESFTEDFVPPAEAKSDDEIHYFMITKKM